MCFILPPPVSPYVIVSQSSGVSLDKYGHYVCGSGVELTCTISNSPIPYVKSVLWSKCTSSGCTDLTSKPTHGNDDLIELKFNVEKTGLYSCHYDVPLPGQDGFNFTVTEIKSKP